MVKNIERAIFKQVLNKLSQSNKIVIIYGARQVGKTTLAEQIIAASGLKTLKINADERRYNDVFGSRDLAKMMALVSGYELLFIDEAQRIENIGINLKILADNNKDLKIVVTGSSSFELANKIKEPLTGRTWTYNLYPLSVLELAERYNGFEMGGKLEELMVFGSYPEVFTTVNNASKRKLLEEIATSYLYKDILELESLKKSDKLYKLLKLLAFQIGSEVSVNELARTLEMSNDSVRRYIDLLEKSFIIVRLSAFSKNPRKEIAKKDKIYFADLGIRNIIIDNLNPLADRNDQGALFENLMFMERLKKNRYQENLVSPYFWHAYTGSEIDYIEEAAGRLRAYEFKYRKEKARLPEKFLDLYGDADFELINKENFFEFCS